jgi:hypothetical protein
MADVDSTEMTAETPDVDFCILIAPRPDEPVLTSDLIYGLHGLCRSLAETLANLRIGAPMDREEATHLLGLALAARNHAETLYDRMGREPQWMVEAAQEALRKATQ